MGHNTKLGWIDKAAVVLTVPLTIIFVSFSSLQIIGKGNSFIDVFLACMVCLGFFKLFRRDGSAERRGAEKK